MNSDGDIYVNPAHKFYCEFLGLVKKALPFADAAGDAAVFIPDHFKFRIV